MWPLISTGWSSDLKVLVKAPLTTRSNPFSKFSKKPIGKVYFPIPLYKVPESPLNVIGVFWQFAGK
jgi:hypothetical protein